MNTPPLVGFDRRLLLPVAALVCAAAQAATVAQPSFSAAAGTYTTSQSVTLTTTTAGASIRYSLDGTTPSATTGTLYTAPVPITATATLKAIAYKSGSTNSTVRTGLYTINSNLISAVGGFEGAYTSGVAPGWVNFPIDRHYFTGSFSESSVARSGAKSQQLQITKLMAGRLQAAIPIPGGIVAGNDYEARVWLKASRRTDHGATLAVTNNTSWFPSSYSYINRPVGQQWTELVLRFRAATTDSAANLAIGYEQESTLWIDDASFRRIVSTDRPAAPAAGNLLRNSSFETGLSGWMAANAASASVATDATAPHGGRVLNLSWYGQSGGVLQSRGLQLPWGNTYTLSFYAKGASGAVIGAAIKNRDIALASQNFTLSSTGWQRCTYTFTLPLLPDDIAYLEIDPPNSGNILLDGVQLQAGSTATAFAPRATVESELVLDRASGVYTTGEAVTGTLSLYNSSTSTQAITLRRRVRDLWDADVAGTVSTWSQSLAPGLTTLAVTLTPSTLTGAFRAECDNGGGTTTPPYAETAFSVLPPAPAPGSNSPFGVCLDYNGTTLTRTGGAGWTKSWLISWDKVQPTSTSPWTFSYDANYNSWANAGLNTLGILSQAPRWAQNVPATGALTWGWYNPVNFAAQTEYARQVVTRYMDRIPLWELENEPTQELHPTGTDTLAQAYAKEALALANGALAADPSALLLLGSITITEEPATFLANVFAAQPALTSMVHGVSYHYYTGDPAIIRRLATSVRSQLDTLGLNNLAIWDTEWYPLDHSLSIYRDEFRPVVGKSDTARRVTALVSQGYIARLGEGLQGSILYQSYNGGGMDTPGHTATYELDGRPRPSLAVTAAAAQQLTGAFNPRPLTVAGCWAYQFHRPDYRTVTTIWTDDYQAGNVNYVTPTDVTVTDMMGNPAGSYLAGQTISIGPEPLYLLGPVSYTVEAESGTVAGGATILNDPPSSGGKCVGSLDWAGRSLTLNNLPNLNPTGQTRIELLTASLNGGALSVEVNGVVVGLLDCPATGGWFTFTNKSAINVTLAPGANTVRFIYSYGATDVDTVTLTPVP